MDEEQLLEFIEGMRSRGASDELILGMLDDMKNQSSPTIGLPEFVVTTSRPLTSFEERDKNNAFRLGLIKENTDEAYRQWQANFHAANLRDKAIGLAGAYGAMGLASILTMANPASMYAYTALGLGNLPNLADVLKLDINNGLYLKTGADAVLTAAELLPAALTSGLLSQIKKATQFKNQLGRTSPFSIWYLRNPVKSTDVAEGNIKMLLYDNPIAHTTAAQVKASDKGLYKAIRSMPEFHQEVYKANLPLVGKAKIVGTLDPDAFSLAYGSEIVERLKNLGIDPNLEVTTKPTNVTSTILKDIISELVKKPTIIADLGSKRSQTLGFYVPSSNKSYKLLQNVDGLPISDIFHEGVMHPTDFIGDLVGNDGLISNMYKWLGDAISDVSSSGSKMWYEVRSTMGEINRDIYRTLSLNELGYTPTSFEDILKLKPIYEKFIDSLSKEELASLFRRIRSSYAGDYASFIYDKASNADINKIKALLKTAPVLFYGMNTAIDLTNSPEYVESNKFGGIIKKKIYKKGGNIHIKKKNEGKFTASAKAAGESVLEHARKILNNPNATPLLKKRANFARNAAKWNH